MSDDLDIPAYTYRVPRRGMDSGTRRLAIIAGSLGGALVLLVGGWSVLGHRHEGVPVIEADSSPLRVKPDNPGGMNVAGTNDQILSGDPDGTPGKLAPGSETPAPQNMTLKPPVVVASAPPATPPVPVPAPAPLVATPAAKPPVPAPAHGQATDHTTHPTGGKTLVQLAALPTEDAAKTEWDRLARRMPDLLGNRQPAVSRSDRDGKVWWRLRTGGFSDIAQATAFCEQVRAKGNGCSIAAF